MTCYLTAISMFALSVTVYDINFQMYSIESLTLKMKVKDVDFDENWPANLSYKRSMRQNWRLDVHPFVRGELWRTDERMYIQLARTASRHYTVQLLWIGVKISIFYITPIDQKRNNRRLYQCERSGENRITWVHLDIADDGEVRLS